MNQFTYGDRHLVVIDDEAQVLRVMERINKKHFPRIQLASNFQDGLIAIQQMQQPQSIVFSDYHLHTEIGLDLAKITHEARKQLQIAMFIMSGGANNTEKGTFDLAKEQGIINGFIEKPFTPNDIQSVIKKYYQELGLEF
jgi:response regulator RpfG family c-di-GMP phosphodiesterase